ncbi:MAG: cytochrome c biogenesis protein CcsA [Anaerolineae bacterium]
MNISQRLHLPHSGAADSTSAEKNSLTTLALRLLSLAAFAGLLFGLYFGLFVAGTDTMQGHVQHIFYFHVAAFSGGAVAFFGAVVGGIVYLRTRKARWDMLALAGVEVGFFLSLITLFTGMVWARPIWNTWWTWDPRLTSTAIMVLTYAAYLMLRGAIENPDKKRAMAAVYGILAFGTVVFTYAIIRIRPDTIHPTVIGSSPSNAEGGFAMTDSMKAALGINSAIWCCFITPALVWWRIRLENLHEKSDQLRIETL